LGFVGGLDVIFQRWRADNSLLAVIASPRLRGLLGPGDLRGKFVDLPLEFFDRRQQRRRSSARTNSAQQRRFGAASNASGVKSPQTVQIEHERPV
jgi:hypothetical protein